MEKQDKQDRIIQAAKELFSRFGIRKTTVDEIAKLAGIGKGTVYLYFKNKEEILVAVLDQIGKELYETLDREIAKGSTASDKLLRYARTRTRFSQEQYQILNVSKETRVEMMMYAFLDPSFYKASIDFKHKEQIFLEAILREGVESGEFEADNLPEVASVIVMAMHVASEHWLLDDRLEQDSESAAELMITLMVNGIRKKA